MSWHWLEDVDHDSLTYEQLSALTKDELICHVISEYRGIRTGLRQQIEGLKAENARLDRRTAELAAGLEELRSHVLDGDPSPQVELWRARRLAWKARR